MPIRFRLVFVPWVCFLLTAGPAISADWKSALKEALRSKYEITKTGIDRLRITQPGTVFVIQKDEIVGDLAGDLSYTINNVKNGEVSQAHGFGAVMQGHQRSRAFQAGEKVYLYDIDVKDNYVSYIIISHETFAVQEKGTTKQTRYKSLLAFQFDKGSLETASADDVIKLVNAVIVPETQAKAAATKTIEFGQTIEEVEAILGKPKTIAKGQTPQGQPQMIYIYPDMKITFTDGKVSDIK